MPKTSVKIFSDDNTSAIDADKTAPTPKRSTADLVQPVSHDLVKPTTLPKYAQNAPAGELPDNLYDIIIIGAGTAGLTAAIYAARANKQVLVLEKVTYGGQIIAAPWIENYPAAPGISGVEFATTLYNQAKNLNVKFKFEEVTDLRDFDTFKAAITTQAIYYGRTVIIATGSYERRMGLENEEELTGRGVSYCAVCDGAFYKNKDVAVLGGGNVALSDALYLSDIARTVHVIHRKGEFRADPFIVRKVENRANTFFKMSTQVTELIADKTKSLAAIKLVDKMHAESTLPIACIFIAIGRVPANQIFKHLFKFDRSGYIKADETCTTTVPGIFVAGDNRTKIVRQLVSAASDGAAAATAAVNLLNGKDNVRDIYTR